MSRKHFSWLLAVTVIVTALVVLIPGKTGKESSFEKTLMLPDLAEQVNDIDWLRLTAAGGETVVTLERREERWIVVEASDYRADWNRLKTLLSDLSRAEIIEKKTSNPDYYARLGVEDVSSEDASGLLIEFSEDSGLSALIMGNDAGGREGQYMRLLDSAESALIDRRLNLPTERSEWLDKTIVDISDAEVVELRIVHPDGEFIRAIKSSADDENFVLQDVPPGQEIKSDWTVNNLANVLTSLNLESVAPEDEFDWSNPVRFSLLTADGLLVETEIVARESTAGDNETAEDEYWMRLKAGLYTTAIDGAADLPDDPSGAAARADSINSRVEGWAYRVLKYKYDSMTRRMTDLLQSSESP
jgi:hypothetical protein